MFKNLYIIGALPLRLFVVFQAFISLTAQGTTIQSLGEMASTVFAKMASNKSISKHLYGNAPPTLNHGLFCPMWAQTPDYYPYVVKNADVHGDYVSLHYEIPAALAQTLSNFPRTLVFTWHRDGNYAPWIVHYGYESVSSIRVSGEGDVAILIKREGPPVHDELRICKLETNPAALNTQYTAYSCFNQIDQGVLLETVNYNYGSSGPDGEVNSMDWSDEHFFYTRKERVNPHSRLNSWHKGTQTLKTLDSIYTSPAIQVKFDIKQVDHNGNVGYGLYDNVAPYLASINAGYWIMAAIASGTGAGMGHSKIMAAFEPTSSKSLTMGAFFQMGGDFHALYNNPSFVGSITAVSSTTSYQNPFGGLVLPANTIYKYPKFAASSIFGEILFVEALNTLTYERKIDVFQYQPGAPNQNGSFIYLETIDPLPGFDRLELALGSGTDIAQKGAFFARQRSSVTGEVQFVLFKCL